MSWYNPRSWFDSPAEQKDRSFDEILRILYANQVSSGEDVTPSNAMRCTTVHAIVRAISNAIGSYPIEVKEERKTGGVSTVRLLPDHPVQSLLDEPNRRTTSTMYFRRIVRDLLLWGNHISLKAQGRSGDVRFLRPVPMASVAVESPENDVSPVYLIATSDRGDRRVSWRNLVHITGGIPSDTVMAMSPVNLAAEAIGLSLAAERMVAELYGNSGIPGVVLKHPGNFANKEQYDIWRNDWQNAYGAGANRGGVGILPNGMDFQEVAFTPHDQQVLEMRKFQRTEIASVYGVPPHKLADLERATFSNIEHQGLEFVADVALPYVKLIEEAFERDLLTQQERDDGVIIRFDLDAAARGDFATRVDGYSKLREIGAMSANEIRAREGLNPRTDDGGDAYLEPLNMRSSRDAGGGETEDSDDEVSEVDVDGGSRQRPVRAV